MERDDQRLEDEAFFILRSADPGSNGNILFMPAVPTWIAYNDFGGGCSYRLPPERGGGGREARERSYAVFTSTHKPWPRGFIRLPVVSVRSAQKARIYQDAPIGWQPSYTDFDYAFANGYSMFAPLAGWAHYDRNFAVWSERAGYQIDYATPHDIYEHPDLLEHYQPRRSGRPRRVPHLRIPPSGRCPP